jgi:hypothetical protein
MYFDAVLNDTMEPLFNGTPGETKKWLEENNTGDNSVRVCIGVSMTLVTVPEYMRRMSGE